MGNLGSESLNNLPKFAQLVKGSQDINLSWFDHLFFPFHCTIFDFFMSFIPTVHSHVMAHLNRLSPFLVLSDFCTSPALEFCVESQAWRLRIVKIGNPGAS